MLSTYILKPRYSNQHKCHLNRYTRHRTHNIHREHSMEYGDCMQLCIVYEFRPYTDIAHTHTRSKDGLMRTHVNTHTFTHNHCPNTTVFQQFCSISALNSHYSAHKVSINKQMLDVQFFPISFTPHQPHFCLETIRYCDCMF